MGKKSLSCITFLVVFGVWNSENGAVHHPNYTFYPIWQNSSESEHSFHKKFQQEKYGLVGVVECSHRNHSNFTALLRLSTHHLKSAQVGDFVLAYAMPINVGKTIQVQEVRFWKIDHH
nr:1,4-dihydroxy-2-naphthoyl-CoA thioesterase 1-like [Ipomoea trifida]